MTVSEQQVETLRKALLVSTVANRTGSRGRDEELSRRRTVSVSELGNTALESALQTLLGSLHQDTLCQFNIGVWGVSDPMGVRVHIWTKRMEIVMVLTAEDLDGDASRAILQALTDMVADFRREPRWEEPSYS